MAFKRAVQLSIGANGTGLSISDLDIEFNIQRSNAISENTAEFVIYNAKESTRKEILKIGNNLIFDYGYDDETMGTLFVGNITTAKTQRSGQDWATTITSASIQGKDKPVNTNNDVSLSYAPDTLLSQPLTDIATILGLSKWGFENANINLENGFVFVGSARGALKYCADILKAHDVALYIDNNTLVVYNTGSRTSRFSPVYLDYNSGLIRVDDVTEQDNQTSKNPKRIGFETIIMPKLQPNGLIVIQKTGRLEGTYLIEKVNFVGNNYGGENRCDGEAIE
jgi:hypothetical protein